MSSETNWAGGELEAWLVSIGAGDGPKLLQDVVARASEAGAEIVVLDGAMVFGKDHLKSALDHAVRAIRERRNASESRAMETLLYASGERQLSAAIRKMSVTADTEEVVVARLGGKPFEPEDGWVPLPERQGSPERKRLLRFGITEKELSTVDHVKAVELVLERVASVDVMKK